MIYTQEVSFIVFFALLLKKEIFRKEADLWNVLKGTYYKHVCVILQFRTDGC